MTEVSISSGDLAAREAGPDPRRWLLLAIIAIAQLMVMLDATIVNIALPSAQKSLGFSVDRQWVVTAYALAFGSLLLFGGRLGDLIGRKITFLGGLIGFAAASAAGGAATSFTMLVTARACQGAFGAFLAPAALSLLSTTFSDPKERGKAFGVYGACAVPKLTHWLELVFTVPSGCSPVLADQAVDDVRALDPAGYIDRLAGFVQRRSLVPRLVRPVFVIVPRVLGQDILEVPFAVDQQVVQALAPQCSHVPLRKGIRPRRPERRLDDPHAIVGEHVIEDGRELAVAVADEELELAGAFAEIHEKVAGLLGGPCPAGVRGDAQDMHAAGLDLHHEEHVQALEEHGVDVQEVTCQDSGCLGGEELPPGRRRPARRRGEPGRCQDPADRSRADAVPEAEELALDAPVPHRGFCLASRRTSSRISPGTSGRPVVFGYVHLFLTICRCQAIRVPGVTIRGSRRCLGSSRASAAITARSAQSGFGRVTWRRSTPTSCRSTKISTSFDVPPRASSTSQPNNRIMSR